MLLNRQKALLGMLDMANRPVGRLELMKWAFLLAQETPSRGGAAFYGFLPYRYGPFSFCLQREMNKLIQMGLVSEVDKKYWNISPRAKNERRDLQPKVWSDIASIVLRFVSHPSKVIINYIYKRHPWYTINSQLKQLCSRPIATPAIYTVGYEGLSVDAFLDLLLSKGIHRLIDVRHHPVPRRFGFHKSTLNRLCEYVAIEYVHHPELGIESSYRQHLICLNDYESLFRMYEQETLALQENAVHHLAELVSVKPSVLVCMEADSLKCHRTRLAKSIAAVNGFKIIDLRE